MCRKPSARMMQRNSTATSDLSVITFIPSHILNHEFRWGGFFVEERTGIRDHACRLENRNAASLTGVREVVSFDENQVVMDTDMGLLTIKGKDLHVSRLTVEKGELEVEGQVDSLAYSSNEAYRKTGQSILARLFG